MNDIINMVKHMRRLSGILMHPTSLPGDFGIGDLGPAAFEFVDFLEASGQHLWQTLPLGPVAESGCPYQCFSSFAGNTMLISPELLRMDNLLPADAFDDKPDFPEDKVDFPKVARYKEKLFKQAFEIFETLPADDLLVEEFEQFKVKEASWLDDYSIFMAIHKEKNDAWWLEWDKKYRKPTKAQKAVIEKELAPQIRYEHFLQWLFFRQWAELKLYANEHGILMIGDIPIFVAADSADVWAQPKMFQLDKDGFPKVVAGVPPDYFSATGQMWGNPLYDWKYHKKTEYSWWMDRIAAQLNLSDIIRIDHFRGLESYWEIPAGSKDATSGKWAKGPGDDFFNKIREQFGEDLPIIAEDLGIITDEVRALRDRFNLPGMKILQFAFEDDDSAYLPYNHPYNCVCYTGTHDNDTTTGWYQTAPEKARDKVRRYMNTDASQVSWDFIRTCFGSVAKYAIVPVQDLLCQGSDCRMNIPGLADGNWGYRVKKGMLNKDIAARLYDVTKLYGR